MNVVMLIKVKLNGKSTTIDNILDSKVINISKNISEI